MEQENHRPVARVEKTRKVRYDTQQRQTRKEDPTTIAVRTM